MNRSTHATRAASPSCEPPITMSAQHFTTVMAVAYVLLGPQLNDQFIEQLPVGPDPLLNLIISNRWAKFQVRQLGRQTFDSIHHHHLFYFICLRCALDAISLVVMLYCYYETDHGEIALSLILARPTPLTVRGEQSFRCVSVTSYQRCVFIFKLFHQLFS